MASKKACEPGIHRKPAKIDLKALAAKLGVERIPVPKALPSLKRMSETAGLTKDNPIRGLTLAEFLGMVVECSSTMCVLWVEITPPLAQFILENFNLVNRRFRRRRFHDLLAMMLAGEFYETTVTVRFDSNGVFFDGQHRLKMIAHSGKSMVLPIGFGEHPLLAQLNTDTGAPRLVRDHGYVATGRDMSPASTFISRHMFQSSPAFANGRGLSGRPMSTSETTKAYEDYCVVIERAADKVLRRDKRHGVWFPKAVAAAVARAYLSHPWDVIDRFCEIICLDGSDMSAMPKESWEIAAIMFRDEVRKPCYIEARHDEDYVLVYALAEQAIHNFIHKITPSRLAHATKELFPLKQSTKLTISLEDDDRAMVEQRKSVAYDVPEGRIVTERATKERVAG
jgi:hypothetical protein